MNAKPATKPRFRLFRLTKPMHDGSTHAGEVWIGGRMWTVTAKVVETDAGRQFQGDVQAPGESWRRNQQDTRHDLVAQAEGMPFDDKIPF